MNGDDQEHASPGQTQPILPSNIQNNPRDRSRDCLRRRSHPLHVKEGGRHWGREAYRSCRAPVHRSEAAGAYGLRRLCNRNCSNPDQSQVFRGARQEVNRTPDLVVNTNALVVRIWHRCPPQHVIYPRDRLAPVAPSDNERWSRGAILESRCCEAGHPYLKRILGLDGLARCFLLGVKSGTSPLS